MAGPILPAVKKHKLSFKIQYIQIHTPPSGSAHEADGKSVTAGQKVRSAQHAPALQKSNWSNYSPGTTYPSSRSRWALRVSGHVSALIWLSAAALVSPASTNGRTWVTNAR